MTIRQSLSLLLVALLAADVPLWAGISSHKSKYVGGTEVTLPKGAPGVLSGDDSSFLSFKPDKDSKTQIAEWRIPYGRVTSLAYGQHAGRRVGATMAFAAVTMGMGALPLLFSKKRRHYLTIGYLDEEGHAHAAMFEVGKNAIRTLLITLQVRTGKKVEYEDEEARKAGSK